MSRLALLLIVPMLLASRTVPATGPVIEVPHGDPVLIDGRIDPEEWQRAAVSRMADGTELRWLHNGVHLFLGITAARRGFPSVCVASGDAIRVFHASAALGAVAYRRSASGWTTRDRQFVYGMRTPELTEAARQERRDYLAQHGWLGSTVRMGDGRVQEMQIALDLVSRTPAVALGYYVIGEGTGSVAGWPESLAPGDGCVNETLVSGSVPSSLRFDPSAWAAVRLAP